MCDKCGKKEDEVLVQTSVNGEVTKTENLCMECFQEEHGEVD
ncbi:hypothetical protein [Sporosarcina sp. FSL W7-1283]